MKQKAIIQQMEAGGFILNNMFVMCDGTAHRDRIRARQIQALKSKDLVTETIGYDRMKTYRLKP